MSEIRVTIDRLPDQREERTVSTGTTVGQLFAEVFAKAGLVCLPGGNTGAQMGGWFRREIKSLSDLQGLKFRIGGMGGQVLAKFGVQPQAIGGPEIYQALETKKIDAAEWIDPAAGLPSPSTPGLGEVLMSAARIEGQSLS